jgi:fibronectin type 3 domain-containing protein
MITVIWEPSTAADLAGYVVLRGNSGDDTLRPLTPAPIRETSYRDADVEAGRRYVYAIVAVDSRQPTGNASAPSPRVEETAR